MAEQELFHIQLHPHETGQKEILEWSQKSLAQTHAIGIDFNPRETSVLKRRHLAGKRLGDFKLEDCKAIYSEPVRAKRISQLCELKPERVGLVRGGQTHRR